MTARFTLTCVVPFTVFLAAIPFDAVGNEISALEYTTLGGDEILDESELIEFLTFKGNIPDTAINPRYQKLIASTDGPIPSRTQLMAKVTAKTRGEIAEFLEKEPPYTADEVDSFFDAQLIADDVDTPFLGFPAAPGITTAKPFEWEGQSSVTFQGSKGPLRLRRKPDDFRPRKGAAGATVQYSDNRLNANGSSWTSEGALIYPVDLELDGFEQGPIRSSNIALGPAVYWNLIDANTSGDSDIRELQFAIPLSIGANLFTDEVSRSITTFSPYYHTDWDFDGGTIGASLAVDYIGDIGGFRIGSYTAVGKPSSDSKLSEILAYRFRVVPKVDYGTVVEGGDHSQRAESDSWLRGGGLVELGFRFFGEESPLSVSTSYEILAGSRNSDESELFKASATRWFNKQVGITAEYQRGETPISDKKLDLFMIGLELKH